MNYIISVKRVKDRYKNLLEEGEQYYCYVGIDNKSGSFSTNYPYLADSRRNATEFESVEKAVEWWNKNKKYVIGLNGDVYDLSTLAIRKEHVGYSLKKKLTVNKDED